jgi:ferredoxin-NADP reductase
MTATSTGAGTDTETSTETGTETSAETTRAARTEASAQMGTTAERTAAAGPVTRAGGAPAAAGSGSDAPGSERELVVRRKETLAEGVVRLTLGPPGGGPLPAWEPGAHLDLMLPADPAGPPVIRQYSLCGDPAEPGAYQVAVLREPEGRGGSRFVHDRLAEGDVVRVRGPRNNFPLVEADRYLFVAGGIGITPLLPMVAAAQARGADWRLVYGGRRRASMAFRRELLAAYGARVTVCPQDEVGLLDLDALLGGLDDDTELYCCGPEPLLAAVERHRAASGARPPRVERFSARQDDSPREETSFEVELTLSGLTLAVPPDRSVIDVVEEAGVTVLSSCREGTCGTCETVVLEGVPDHRDVLLTEEEQAAGDTMMICVSRARSPRLVLEL